jgi:hypothetical protein
MGRRVLFVHDIGISTANHYPVAAGHPPPDRRSEIPERVGSQEPADAAVLSASSDVASACAAVLAAAGSPAAAAARTCSIAVTAAANDVAFPAR